MVSWVAFWLVADALGFNEPCGPLVHGQPKRLTHRGHKVWFWAMPAPEPVAGDAAGHFGQIGNITGCKQNYSHRAILSSELEQVSEQAGHQNFGQGADQNRDHVANQNRVHAGDHAGDQNRDHRREPRANLAGFLPRGRPAALVE